MSTGTSEPRELKIRPAPKLWEKPRPAPLPRKLDPATRAAETQGGTPIMGAILLLGCTAALLVLGGPRGTDPHLARARELIGRYQELRVSGIRDYESQAYRNALAELDQVSLQSASGQEAAELAQEIRARIEAQRAAARSRAAELAVRQERRQERDQEFFEALKRSRLVQGGEHDECKDEAPSADHDHHAHHDHAEHHEHAPAANSSQPPD